MIVKKLLAIMTVALALALGVALVSVYAKPAVTVSVPEDAVPAAESPVTVGESVVKLESDGSNPIADEIVRIYNAQPQTGDEGSHVTDVTVGSDSKTALVSISAHEDGAVRLSVYNDYELDEERKTLLWQSEPVPVSAEAKTLGIGLEDAALPEDFIIEATYTTDSGSEETLAVYTYTRDYRFVESATAEDFAEGYYVPIDTRRKAGPSAKSFSSAGGSAAEGRAFTSVQSGSEGGYTTGYVAYNKGLILLDSSVTYTKSGTEDAPLAVFGEIPAQMRDMTGEELAAVEGFVFRGETPEDDVFLLSSGITLTDDGGMIVSVREPESLHELYDAVKLDMAGVSAETWVGVNDEYVNGQVSYTPDAGVHMNFGMFYAKVVLNLGNFGHFDLNFKKGTFSGDLSVDHLPPATHKIELSIPDMKFGYKGLGMSTKSSIHVAANNRVHVRGKYGLGVAVTASIGTKTGFNFEKQNERVCFTEVTPLDPNVDTYVYFGRDSVFSLELGVLHVNLLFTSFDIGPILSANMHLNCFGTAVARFEKDVEQAVGDDILHECIAPGKAGCINGETLDGLEYKFDLKLNVYVYDHTWKLSQNIERGERDYFYHSLEHDEQAWDTKKLYCPHELFRFGVKTTENKTTPLKNSVVTGSKIAEVSVPVTDEDGLARNLYMPMVWGESTVSADDEYGAFIGTGTVSKDELLGHKTIVIDRYAAVIKKVDLEGWFPADYAGSETYAGKDVGKNAAGSESGRWYYPVVFNIVESEEDGQVYQRDWYGTKMSVSWDGECPDTTTEITTEPGVMHAQIVVDFSSSPFADGLARLDPNVEVTVLGDTYANPKTIGPCDYRFAITGVSVSDGTAADGSFRQDAVLTVTVDFYIRGAEDDYVLVLVENGLPSCEAHFYPRGSTAVAIGRDIGSQRDTLFNMVRTLDPAAWYQNEKEQLKTEIRTYPDSENAFREWYVYPEPADADEGLDYPKDFRPVVTQDGVLSYNAVTFTVPKNPELKKIRLRAVYESVYAHEIEEVYLTVRAPVPDEFLSGDEYATGAIATVPGREETPAVCHVKDAKTGSGAEAELDWSINGNRNRGAIRYNTTYIVEADVMPQGTYWRFKYPLGSSEGTKAYILPDGDSSKKAAAIDFTLIYDGKDQMEMLEPEEFSADAPVGRIRYAFTTRKAKLLKVYNPDDLWFVEGTQPEVINAALRYLDVAILAEDKLYTSTTAQWDAVTAADIPAAGSSFTVKGKADLPDELECDDESILNTKVVIHIYGAGEIPPPTADPPGGVYRSDLDVTLSTVTEGAEILYYVETPFETGSFEPYTEPVTLRRAANETVVYTIYAKAVLADETTGRTLESKVVSFTYVLEPADTEYRLIVRGGRADSYYGCGSTVVLPAWADVTLSPLGEDGLKFDHWEILEGPDGTEFPWAEGSDESVPEAAFSMPCQDVIIAAVYTSDPDKNVRVIDKVDLFMNHSPYGVPHVGDPALPETEGKTVFLIEKPNGSFVTTALSDAEGNLDALEWDREVSEEEPVTYGEDYTFTTQYTIEEDEETEDDLIQKTMSGSYSNETRFHRDDHYRDYFAPAPEVTVGGVPVTGYFVSDDLNRLVVAYTYSFPPETYTLRYDANGGSLGNVPAQVVQLKNIETPLTEEKPVHPDGAVFLGWSTDPEAKEPEYVYSEENNPVFKEDTTLYAVWPDYAVRVFWLDHDNASDTRRSFNFSIGGSTYTADPEQAEEKDGAGFLMMTVKAAPGDGESVEIEGEEDGYIRFGEIDGSENIYSVEVLTKKARADIILTAKRELHVKKTWDIDLEEKDRPDSVTMILQGDRERPDGGILEALLNYLRSGDGEDWENVITELESTVGYSLKGLSAEAVAGKIAHLIASGSLSEDSLTDSLKSLLKADTNDSEEAGYYGYQTLSLSESNGWAGTFEPEDRFEGECSIEEDGSVTATWKDDEIKYRVVEKSGKAPVEDGEDASFKVPAYTDLSGRQIDEHKTVYQVSYETDGDTTEVTNLAVEDHYIRKEWILFGDAEKPENVYVLLMWKYDPEYMESAQGVVSVEDPGVWLPEQKPISGDMISVADILEAVGIPLPIGESIKIPLAIAKLNEDNEWKAMFRVKKYGMGGLPLKHEAAEFFGAVCQDVIKYFTGLDIPIGINPLQGFVTVSVPEISVPYTADKVDAVINTWAKFDPDPDPDPDPDHVLTGVKVWEDENNADRVRPEKITLHVWEDGSRKITDITVKENGPASLVGLGVWTWSYKDDAIDTGKHSYSVTEDAVPGYTAKISGLNVTNVHKTERQEFVTLEVTKVWDEDTAAAHEPLTVNVTRDGAVYRPVELNQENNWTVTIPKEPKAGQGGRAYRFGIEEPAVPEGYAVSYDVRYDGASSTWRLSVTNTRTVTPPEKVNLSGRKIWDDAGDKDGIRPPEVTVRLLADGKEVAVYTLSGTNGWHWNGTFDKFDGSGKEIRYTVTEDPVTGYTTSYSGLDVTNRHKPEPDPKRMSVLVKKAWSGTDSAHPKTPVQVQLLQNGEPLGSAVTLNADNGWQSVIDNLDAADKKGNAYTYTVREDPVPAGFSASVTYTYSASRMRLTATVTNTLIGKEDKEIGGTKIWDDNENALGRRPESVRFSIIAKTETVVDGATVTTYKTVDEKVLNKACGWAWSGLYPKFDESGRPVSYSVSEDPVPGYTPSYSADGLSVTNTLTGSLLTVTNTVLNGDKEKPFPFVISLTDEKGGEFDGSLLSEVNGVRRLIAFSNGKARIALADGGRLTVYGISDGWQYLIREEENSDYLTWVVDKENLVGKDEKDLTSRRLTAAAPAKGDYPDYTRVVKSDLQDSRADFYNDRMVSVTVNKVWEDSEDPTKRPGSITVNLLANGRKKESAVITENAEGSWTHTFTELPACDSTGREIAYTITENPVKGYETVIKGYTIYNTLIVEKYTFAFYKVWRDDLAVHDTPTFILYYADGTVCKGEDEQPRRSRANAGRYVYELDEETEYYVVEVPMEGYTTTYRNTPASGRADVKDRVYNKGTIVNTAEHWNPPKTGDGPELYVYAALAALSAVGFVFATRRKRRT